MAKKNFVGDPYNKFYKKITLATSKKYSSLRHSFENFVSCKDMELSYLKFNLIKQKQIIVLLNPKDFFRLS